MLTLECQTIARACGKSHVHNLEPEDLVALSVEAAAMARVREGHVRGKIILVTDRQAASSAVTMKDPA